MNEIAHHIDGSHVAGTSGRTQPVFNPATGTSEKTVALASTAEVDAAVAAAKVAWPMWSKTPALRRARILDRFKTILWDRAEQMAEVIPPNTAKRMMTLWARSPAVWKSLNSQLVRPVFAKANFPRMWAPALTAT